MTTTTEPLSQKPKRRALVVDDVSVNRRLMSSVLLCDGLYADEASDVATAIAALDQEQYEVVLLDLSLGPGGSGYDVLRAIRSRPDLDPLPVLLVSGATDDPESIARGLMAGANDFLSKPFNPTILRARVAAARRSRSALLETRERETIMTALATRAEDELAGARFVQRAALPRVPIRRHSFRVTGEVLPSGHISGDLFDVCVDSDRRVSVLLVDVAGHGASAAIVASAARMIMTSSLSAGDSLERVMQNLVGCLLAQGDVPEATAAVAIARFDPSGETVEVVNAGLPPILCVQPSGEVICFESKSAPAGLFESTQHVSETATIELGSLLILSSDGLSGRLVPDEMGPLIQRFDVPQRGTAVASASSEHVTGIIRELMRTFGTSSEDDDATLVIVANEEAPRTLREGWVL